MDSKKLAQAKRIGEINDIFRQTLMGGKIVFTPKVRALSPNTIRLLLGALRRGNSKRIHKLYHEKNTGAVVVQKMKFVWNIDYCDRDDESQKAEDPTDIRNTLRILTVMMESEVFLEAQSKK